MQLHAAQQGPVLVHYEDGVFPATLLGWGRNARVQFTNGRVMHVPRRSVSACAPRRSEVIQ